MSRTRSLEFGFGSVRRGAGAFFAVVAGPVLGLVAGPVLGLVIAVTFGASLTTPVDAQRGPGSSLDDTTPSVPQKRDWPPASPPNSGSPGAPSANPKTDPRSGNPRSDGPRVDGPKSDGQKDGQKADGQKSNSKTAEANKEAKPMPRSLRRPGGTSVPEGAGQRAQLLGELYAYLATATDEDVAKQTAAAIEQIWQAANTDTVNLLMERAGRAVKEKKVALADKLLEQAVQLAPDNADVFLRRAMHYYGESNLERAMGDLRRALALDPNNYRALDALGNILRELERKKAALQVFRRLYEVHPYFSGAKSVIDELAREIEGQAS